MNARAAREGDYTAFARLFGELATGERVLDEARWCAEQMPSTVVVEEGGVVVGYAAWRRGGDDLAHVANVVVAPERRGRRLADALLARVAADARAAGCTRWQLNVKLDNEPAVRLYRRWGFVETGDCSHAMALAWADVPRLEGGDHVVRPLAVEEDGLVEASFGLPRGMLAPVHARPGPLLRADDATGGLVAFGCYDASFPGFHPFRARTPAAAHALVLAVRPLAREDDAAVRLAVADEALAAALLAAGATTAFTVVLLRAPLPA